MDINLDDIWKIGAKHRMMDQMKDMPLDMSFDGYKEKLHEDSIDQLEKDYPDMIHLLQLMRNVMIKSELSTTAIKMVMCNDDDKADHIYQLNRTVELTKNLTSLINGLYKEKELYEEK